MSSRIIRLPLRENLVSDDLLRERQRIPQDVYHQILTWMPIVTVDFVPTRIRDGKREFMLARRNEEPFKGTWFVTGGRKTYGERTEQALRRQLKRELGIDLESPDVTARFATTLDVLNPASDEPGGRPLWHSTWLLHEVELRGDIEAQALAENGEIRWFRHIEPDFPEPVQRALEAIGFYPEV